MVLRLKVVDLNVVAFQGEVLTQPLIAHAKCLFSQLPQLLVKELLHYYAF